MLPNIVSYEQMQECLALLKMVAQNSRSMREEYGKPVKTAFTDVRERVKATGK